MEPPVKTATATNTLPDNKTNLWDNNGAPLGLDMLHNVEFLEPMDIAILLGSEDADFTDAFEPLANGYAFGYTLTGGPPAGGFRSYRVRLVVL